jgi:hypothetical protein
MRKTVMIGAMKPMTAGHYALITEAVADSKVPEGETPANETYVLMSVQDRIKPGELPVSGEAALTAMRDVYLKNTSLMKFNENKFVHLVFCHSARFAIKNPKRIVEIRKIIDDIKNILAANGLTNVTTKIEESQSGPPTHLVSLAEANPDDTFVLYTGADDLKKYQQLSEYASNIELAGFERFEGGMSGTEIRSLIQKTKEEYSDEDEAAKAEERFSKAFPPGVDPDLVRKHYREKAGLDTLEEVVNNVFLESDDLLLGTEEYGVYIDEIISALSSVKGSLGTRKKAGKYYRKEGDRIQSAISSLRFLKRKSDRQLLSNSAVINEVYEGKVGKVTIEREDSFDRETLRKFLKQFSS